MTFPTNPSPGDSYTDEYGTVWVYAGTVNGWYRQTVTTPNDTSYTAAISGPAGSNTQVQFNDNGELAGDSGLTYNKTTDALSGGAFIPTGSTVPSNGLYRPSANNVALSTNGTGRLFVDASGNVGVGGAPVYKLHVLASTGAQARITNSDATSTAQWFAETTGGAGISFAATGASYTPFGAIGASNGYIYTPNELAVASANAIKFGCGASAAERLRITSAGLVGIGTSTPQAQLDVRSGAAGFSQFVHASGAGGIKIAGTGPNSGANLVFANNQSVSTTDRYTIQYDGSNGLQFLQGGTAGTSTLYLSNTNRVGIGTSSPQNILHLRKATGDAVLRVQSGGVNGDKTGIRFQNSSDSTNHAGGIYCIRNSGTDHDLQFQTYGAGGVGTTRLTIKNSGNVGIGTTSPSNPLSVYHATINNVALFESGDANCEIAIADNTGRVAIGNAGDNLRFLTSSSGTERARIDSSGRLLVGTSSNFDGSALQVNGNISQSSVFQQYTASFSGGDVTTKTLNIIVNNSTQYATSLVEVKGSFARDIGARRYYYRASFAIEETGATVSALFDESANGVTASLSFSGQTASLVLTFSNTIRKGTVCVTSTNSSTQQYLTSVAWA